MLLLLLIYLVLGFMYAWIAGVVAKEEVAVRVGVLVVVLPALVKVALRVAEVDIGFYALGVDLALLIVGGKFIA
ncbi:MAG: hypothetical protein DHS20C14_17100 [Phycisphaeraceae bacterium]|nr:MAG: hypothetical protein DHS20C14_17100 [Phycisphaeraceae bacterium]